MNIRKYRKQVPVPQLSQKSISGQLPNKTTVKPPSLQISKTISNPLSTTGHLGTKANQEVPKEMARDNNSQSENIKDLEAAKVQSEHNEDYSLL